MRIGFCKVDITPQIGVELGGYAGYRPCTGIHDPLWCRCVIVEHQSLLYALIQLDLMCADEPLCRRIAQKLTPLGIPAERLIVTAIHTHSAPCGVVPGEGLMERIQLPGYPADESYLPYLDKILKAAYTACCRAMENLESFAVRTGQGAAPVVGSERHGGNFTDVMLTVVECRTESGRGLILYNFPCHPTVMGPGNREVTADFAAGIENQLDVEMAIFLNGAAGDVSTRYTRKAQTFSECDRLGTMAAESVCALLKGREYLAPGGVKGIRGEFAMQVRPVEPVMEAKRRLEELTKKVAQAQAEGADGTTIRTLKSYVEGAGINLQFAMALGDLQEIRLDICAFSFAGLNFVTVPGELFSSLLPDDGTCVIGYANGYNLYIADEAAYDAQYYEAMASLFARGEGERLMKFVRELLQQLKNT